MQDDSDMETPVLYAGTVSGEASARSDKGMKEKNKDKDKYKDKEKKKEKEKEKEKEKQKQKQKEKEVEKEKEEKGQDMRVKERKGKERKGSSWKHKRKTSDNGDEHEDKAKAKAKTDKKQKDDEEGSDKEDKQKADRTKEKAQKVKKYKKKDRLSDKEDKHEVETAKVKKRKKDKDKDGASDKEDEHEKDRAKKKGKKEKDKDEASDKEDEHKEDRAKEKGKQGKKDKDKDGGSDKEDEHEKERAKKKAKKGKKEKDKDAASDKEDEREEDRAKEKAKKGKKEQANMDEASDEDLERIFVKARARARENEKARDKERETEKSRHRRKDKDKEKNSDRGEDTKTGKDKEKEKDQLKDRQQERAREKTSKTKKCRNRSNRRSSASSSDTRSKQQKKRHDKQSLSRKRSRSRQSQSSQSCSSQRRSRSRRSRGHVSRDRQKGRSLHGRAGQGPCFGGGPMGLHGLVPPGMIPPGMMPPGMMPLGMMPPAIMLPSTLSPGIMLPGMMPPGMLFPGTFSPCMMPTGPIPLMSLPKASRVEQAIVDMQDSPRLEAVDPRMPSASRSKSRSSRAPPAHSLKAEGDGAKAETTESYSAAGGASGIGGGQASLDDRARNLKQPEKVDWLELPRALIGRIIGTAGATIKDIRERSGARIDARDQTEDPVQVIISGANDAVECAKLMLLDVAEKAALTLGRDDSGRDDTTSGAGAAAAAAAAVAAVNAAKVAAAPVTLEALGRVAASEQQSSEQRTRKGFSDEPPATGVTALSKTAPAAEVSSPLASSVVEEVLELPMHSTGKVIGTKGVQIGEVRIKSGAQVDIDKSEIGCRVRLQGTPEQVVLARSLITHILIPPLAGDFLEIPRNAVGRIIGAGGSRIQELQERSSAKIDIDRTNPERCLVRFAGTEEAVAGAKALVLEVLEGRTTGGTGDIVQTMEVAPSFTGRLIGPGGKQINEIQQQSGAKVDIDKSTDPCTVRMAGTAESVAKAQIMVQDVISSTGPPPAFEPAGAFAIQSQQQGVAPGTGDVMASVARAAAVAAQRTQFAGLAFSVASSAADEETIKFDIPAHLADRVLGNGTWLQAVSRRTGARIATRRDANSCCLVLSGQPEQVVEAEQLAEDAVRCAGPFPASAAPPPHPPGTEPHLARLAAHSFQQPPPHRVRPPGLKMLARPPPASQATPCLGPGGVAMPTTPGSLCDDREGGPQARRVPPVLTAQLRPSMAAAAAMVTSPTRPGGLAPPGAVTTALRPSMKQSQTPPVGTPGETPLSEQVCCEPRPMLTASLRPSMAAATASPQARVAEAGYAVQPWSLPSVPGLTQAWQHTTTWY